MKIISLIGIFCLNIISVSYLNAITVYNTTDEVLFIASYYVNSEAIRSSDTVMILPQENKEIVRPARKIGYDRELVFTEDENELQDSLAKTDFNKLFSKNIGTLQGNTIYIAQDNDILAGYNSAEWNILYPLQSKALEKINLIKDRATAIATRGEQQLLEMKYALTDQIKTRFTFAQQNLYKDQIAQVRVGNRLSSEEKDYIAQRMPRVKNALEQLLNKKLSNAFIPKIALILSGGGYRAALASTGAFVALDELGIFDALSYVAALSGSTWALGPFMASGLSAPAFRSYIIDTIVNNKGLANIGPHRAELIGQEILTRFLFDGPITIIDFYGGLMANALLHYAGDLRQRIYLSEQSKRIAQGRMPLPIYTAVRADVYPEVDWYEFTPFEVGASWLGMYVPTWAYGRLFFEGTSINDAPEVSLGYMLATYGSAFAVTFNRLYEEIAGSIPSLTMRTVIEKILTVVGQKRLFSAQVPNFTYGIPQSIIKDQNIMNMADAGIDFNLPYPPISGQRPERMADIMIIIDVAAGLPGQELYKAEQYARKHNLKFPRINRATVEKQSISIFKNDTDPSVPIIIYLPFVHNRELLQTYKKKFGENDHYVKMLETFNPSYCVESDVCSPMIWQSYKYKLAQQGYDVRSLQDRDPVLCTQYQYCSSFSFAYTREQAEKLVLQSEFNLKANKEKIIEAINWKIEQRR